MRVPARHLLALAVLVGCGASAETPAPYLMVAPEPENVPDGHGAGESSESETVDAPMLGQPEKLTDLPANAETVPLHLYVTNQSFDISPVGIDVWLQETHVITGGFAVEGQHTLILFDLEVPIGNHVLRAEALEGSVVLTATIQVPAERWGVLSFWYSPGEPTQPTFRWTPHDGPVEVE